jgi:hypothetical protein
MCWERSIQKGPFGKGPFGLWVLAGLRSSILYRVILAYSNILLLFIIDRKFKLAIASRIGLEI